MGYDVILLPTQGQVLDFRKKMARAAIDGSAEAAGRAASDDIAKAGDAASAAVRVASDGAASRGGDLLFGVTVTTFDAWVDDLWELFGDGRALVSPVERELVLSAVDFSAVGEASGLAALAARCVHQAAGLREFEEALKAVRTHSQQALPQGLQPAEKAFLGALASYFEALDHAGLVERGSALARLTRALPRETVQRVLMEGFPPLTLQQRRFFEALPQLRVEEHPALGAQGVMPPSDGVRVRFAFPSGRYAWPRLLVDTACDLRDLASSPVRIVLAGADASATYDEVTSALEREGFSCSLRARKPFPDTDFGRVLFALRRLATDDVAKREDVVDALFSPLMGVSAARVWRFDERLRKDRLIDVRAECAALRATNDMFAYLEELATDSDAVVLAGALEDAIRVLPGVSEAYRCEQMGALSLLRSVYSAACRLGVGVEACLSVLSRASVDVSREGVARSSAARATQDVRDAQNARGTSAALVARNAQESTSAALVAQNAQAAREGASPRTGANPPASSVLVCDRTYAATLPPRSCDVLVLCDMTSESWPVVERDNSAAALLAKLGLLPTDDALSRARREFCALEGVPAKQLIIERCLFDASAEPTYPAMVVEELVDCYRVDPSATEDIDNPYALPPLLRENVLERGEERLYENLAVATGSQPVAARVECPSPGEVRPERKSLVVLSRAGKKGHFEPCFSASQIENYLLCPYLWFVQRRLRIQPIDEEFGPLQMGDFAHHSLEGFYQAFQQRTGLSKVTPASLGEARAIMEETLAEQQALQFALKPGDNRLVPLSEVELREVEDLKARLVRYLDFEAQLLPGFRPLHLEYGVGETERVEYAGVRLTGKIDRIDVDDQGHAVIIDYKGSLSADYEADARLKVQALVYAQVIKRLLGLDVVGALYVCYGRTPKLAGAYDACVLETPHLPRMRHDRCACSPASGHTFAQLLDETEQRVAQAMEGLIAGKVAPDPLGPSACAWCPVAACLKRRA